VHWSYRYVNRSVLAVTRWVERVGAIVPGTDGAELFGTFGARSYISYPHGTRYGLSSVHIGEDTLIGRNTALIVGYSPHDEHLPERGLVIGDRCVLGANLRATAHESITIGDDVWFGQDVFVSDASHGYQNPEAPIGTQLGKHEPVAIGSGSWIGHGVVILPGTTIGRQVVVGAGSVVRGTIPDHTVVAGVPAKVVRRLEPGVGWVATSSGDVRPAWTTEQVEAALRGEIELF